MGGTVKSVTVYPSDYGLSCMKEEAIHGPPKFIWKSSTRDSTDHLDGDTGRHSDSEDSASDQESDEDVNLIDINDLPQDEEGEGDFTRPPGSKPGIVFQHDDDEKKSRSVLSNFHF